MSAFVQFDLVTLSFLLTVLDFTSILRTQWSLFPILPPSLIEIIRSEQFVSTKSKMLPLVCVGKLTSCSRFSVCAVSMTCLPLAAEVIFGQIMSGKLISPIIID